MKHRRRVRKTRDEFFARAADSHFSDKFCVCSFEQGVSDWLSDSSEAVFAIPMCRDCQDCRENSDNHTISVGLAPRGSLSAKGASYA